MQKITAIKGFNDILPDEARKYAYIERILIKTLGLYGYQNIRLPIVEQTQLFARGVGEATDIVEKEMYSFLDKSNPPTALTLRPEGTAGAVRAIIEHNLTRGATPKLWYIGPMFRYEKPQKGRYRQFHQLGVEVFGLDLPDVDAELIALSHQMFCALGIDTALTLRINCLGTKDERAAYRAALVDYLQQFKDGLDDDSIRRLDSNPLRILDSKDEQTQAILQGAPALSQFLGAQSSQEFEQLQNYLHTLGIDFVIDERLVRGLDYYNKTVFEWTTDRLGAQATVCGGGRYDGLIGLLKGAPEKTEPAVGFAIGLERLLLLVEEIAPIPLTADCQVFVVAQPEYYANGMLYAQQLRNQGLSVQMSSATSLKSQMKKADRSGAAFCVIIGQDEVQNHTITLKNMQTGEQSTQDADKPLSI